jgi:hypothetical protein
MLRAPHARSELRSFREAVFEVDQFMFWPAVRRLFGISLTMRTPDLALNWVMLWSLGPPTTPKTSCIENSHFTIDDSEDARATHTVQRFRGHFVIRSLALRAASFTVCGK